MELSQAHLRYLLAIGELSQGKAAVSSTQVARVLQVSRPSVTRMLAVLAEKDLVTKERYGKITLTETGAALAHSLFPSHLSISEQTVEIAPAYLYSAGGQAASNKAVDDPATTAAEATAALSGGETQDIDTEGTSPEAGETEGVGAEAASRLPAFKSGIFISAIF